MGVFKILGIRKACEINWRDFLLECPESFSGMCSIYVEKLDGNVQRDLDKISQIKALAGLNRIEVISSDFRIADYFDKLLEGFEGRKEFDLLNDLEIRDRANIDFSKFHYDEVTVPYDYLMYIKNSEGIHKYSTTNFKSGKIIESGESKQYAYPDMKEKIDSIIDEIFGNLAMEALDDVDKSVLVSNWIQKNIQFIEGKISTVKNKRYICEDFNSKDDIEDVKTIMDKKFGVCNGIAKLSVALLSNPRVGCKCNMAHSPGHAYFTQIIDGKTYVTDNTWCISRNPNHMKDSLKASEFSSEYLLIGQDKINENESTLAYHTRYGIYSGKIEKQGISGERIEQSVQKLKSLGVDFSYNQPPIFIQHEEQKEFE